jgi:hypothetical protein
MGGNVRAGVSDVVFNSMSKDFGYSGEHLKVELHATIAIVI